MLIICGMAYADQMFNQRRFSIQIKPFIIFGIIYILPFANNISSVLALYRLGYQSLHKTILCHPQTPPFGYECSQYKQNNYCQWI